ncbi:MAG: type I methionyl aminopeptidase [Verrucomicrobiae bacterium]|nr:type I methionyl aminopeptidase [Verrucomicrobiae bacterium]MCX7722126.1 type I methionyl aminopeptidase [Verrucomicrobiae bacterium]MDW7979391.1 type I methionyl aminopeptidase [Verrucomicrobiales bacterium]
MIVLKTKREIDVMRVACDIASAVLQEVVEYIRPGMTTKQIDEFAAQQIKKMGAKSAFLGYKGYPCHICISVNEEVVHGVAGSRRLEFGDIVSLDVGVVYRGFIGDLARTVAVGGCSLAAQHLMDVTEQALYEGIAQARPGNRVADISRAIQTCVERHGFNVVREFVGHGVGRAMHEEPQVPNFVDGKPSPRLRPGMTLAIEPMVTAGQPAVKVLNDGWTVVTRDGSLSAHFEHTVLVTDGEPEILTWHERTPSKLKVS